MQGNARDPLRVTREAVDAYERQAGFQSMENITVEHGVRVIVPSKDVVQPMWRSVERRPVDSSGLRRHHAVASPCNRANLAAIRQAGAA